MELADEERIIPLSLLLQVSGYYVGKNGIESIPHTIHILKIK